MGWDITDFGSAGTGPDIAGAAAAPEIVALVRRLSEAVGEHAAEAVEMAKKLVRSKKGGKNK